MNVEGIPLSLSTVPDATPEFAVKPGSKEGTLFPRMTNQLREWLRILHHDPTAEERASTERRNRLLEELNHAVADAPDDMPLRTVISRLTNSYSD